MKFLLNWAICLHDKLNDVTINGTLDKGINDTSIHYYQILQELLGAHLMQVLHNNLDHNTSWWQWPRRILWI